MCTIMKKNITFLLGALFVSLISNFSYSQCSENQEPKVLLVGDSWAFFMNADNTINDMFARWGHTDKEYYTNLTLSENGAETDDFLQQSKLDEIETQLNNNPSIEFVHLSLGGNDVLGSWNVNFTQAQTDSLKDTVFNRLSTIIETIKTFKPGIRIVWSGYMYPNFEEVIEDAAPFQSQHPFYGTWQGMGFPSFAQLNGLLNDFSSKIQTYVDADPQLFFVNATALMQYEFGQSSPLGVAPGGTYPPYSQPLPAGDPTYPSPKESMRDYGVTRDCFHLSGSGYDAMIDYTTRKYYHKALMDDQYFLSEAGNMEGSVDDGGSSSPMLYLGNDGTNEYKLQLTFNTTTMIDNNIQNAEIFLRRKQLVNGTDPISGQIDVRVIQGNFGTTGDVEGADYNDSNGEIAASCQFGSTGDDEWIRIELPSSLYTEITDADQTQFLLSISGGAAGMVEYYDGSNPEFAPVLNIDYAGFDVGTEEIAFEQPQLLIYPNPTNGIINIKTEGQKIENIEVFNMMGQMVFNQMNMNTSSIDLSNLDAGNYVMRVRTDQHVSSEKIVIR